MKEIQEILKKIKTLKSDEKAILATVVDVQGSSYRLPGAKMLILENGDTFGTVSGGCLEADVLERAKQVLETGEPQIFVYDTTKMQDSVFSLNMGCRGIIRILLEPIRDNLLLDFTEKCFDKQQHGLSATLIKSKNDLRLGSRLILDKNTIFHNDFNKNISDKIFDNAQDILSSGKSDSRSYNFGEVFFDYISPSVNLTIFGAGADAVPLAEIAKDLGWRVTVVDHREKFANQERFANADEILISHPEQTAENIEIDENSVAVIMTHNYEHDKNILKVLLKSNAKYIGKLGPKRRSGNILREFAEEGFIFSDEELNKFYSPVGLDIGADTPEAIALSIVAEINAVLKERDGGHLKNREGSIYGRN
jgi:xanthine/CO dehydrogenase XdhC/CoxF family maturation factor